jgi:hypothetical protein
MDCTYTIAAEFICWPAKKKSHGGFQKAAELEDVNAQT